MEYDAWIAFLLSLAVLFVLLDYAQSQAGRQIVYYYNNINAPNNITFIPSYNNGASGTFRPLAAFDSLQNSSASAVQNTSVTFTESGLPSGQQWDVVYKGTAELGIAPNSIVFHNASGSNQFVVASIVTNVATYAPSPPSGSASPGNTITIRFSGGIQAESVNNTPPPGAGTNSSATSPIKSNATAQLVKSFFNLTYSNGYNIGVVVANNSNVGLRLRRSVLRSIVLGFNSNDIRFSVSVFNQTQAPAGIKNLDRPVYQFIQINGSTIGTANEIDQYVQGVTYNFSIPASWIVQHKIGREQVKLFKYSSDSDSWSIMPTAYTGSNLTNDFYSATSNSLSIYAVSYTDSSNSVAASSVSITLPSNYTTYFWAGAGNARISPSSATVTTTWTASNSAEKSKTSGGGSTQYVNYSSIGFQTSSTGTLTMPSGATNYNSVLVGVGANVYFTSNKFNGYVYGIQGTGSTTSTLSYTDVVANSFDVILFAIAGNAISSVSTTASGCNQQQLLNSNSIAGAAVITCNSVAGGSYTATLTPVSGKIDDAYAIVVYDFPSYNVVLNDVPTSGNIQTAGGITEANGANVYIIGQNTMSGVLPAAQPTYGFLGWTANNAVNLTILSPNSATTNVIVEGNAILTAYYTNAPSLSFNNPAYYQHNDNIIATAANSVNGDTVNIIIDGVGEARGTNTASYIENTLSVGAHTVVANDITTGVNTVATLTIVKVPGVVYCVGGDAGSSGVATSNVFYAPLYSGGVGSWVSTNAYPSAAASSGCAVSNAIVYCAGGDNPGGLTTNVFYAPLYSGGVGSWVSTNAYPVVIEHNRCVTSNGIDYCVGGLYGASSQQTNDTYYAPLYSGGTGSWLSTNTYPSNIFRFSCVASNGFDYCIAGNTFSGAITTNVFYAPLYSGGVGSWVSTNAYPVKEEQEDCATSKGIVYCVGGRMAGDTATSNVFYAPTYGSGVLGSWVSTNAYPEVVFYESCVPWNGIDYCVGGQSTGDAVIGDVYYAPLYSGGTGSWLSTNAYPSKDTQVRCVSPSLNTTFTETGLPQSGETWNVIYAGENLNVIVPNSIVFMTIPGNFPFAVNNVYSGGTYTPSPAAGNVVAGNTTAITFSSSSTCQVSIDNSIINFGSVSDTSSAPTSNKIVDTNSGGIAAYLYVYGSNWVLSSTVNFFVSNTEWNPTSLSTFGGNALTLTVTNTLLLIPGSSGSNAIYFGLQVPSGQATGTYASNIVIDNVC